MFDQQSQVQGDEFQDNETQNNKQNQEPSRGDCPVSGDPEAEETEEQAIDRFLQHHSQAASISEPVAKFLKRPATLVKRLPSPLESDGLHSQPMRRSSLTDWTSRNPTNDRKEPFWNWPPGSSSRKENVAFSWGLSAWKTHLIYGRQCCALGYRVRYETMCEFNRICQQGSSHQGTHS
ncbi:MAG: hypothetical protein R3C53_03525 [Pirellulaceae bacterium]